VHVYVTTAALHQLVKRDEPDAWQSTFAKQPEPNFAGHIEESVLAQSLSIVFESRHACLSGLMFPSAILILCYLMLNWIPFILHSSLLIVIPTATLQTSAAAQG
jgi:hypothetical protein